MIRLLREEEAAVRKDAKKEPLRRAVGQGQLWLQMPGLVREALYETVIAAGLACVNEVLEGEQSGLCRPSLSHAHQQRSETCPAHA